jgi:hypothetical protein
MLEHATLLLLPWSESPEKRATGRGRTRTRAILDAVSGRPLGFARRCYSALPWGLGWLARPVVEVHESEDASLLLTLHGPGWLLGGWEVLDADDHRVGRLRGSAVLDCLGRPLARVSSEPGGNTLRFLTSSGCASSILAPSSAGAQLTFAQDLMGDPFAKMLLLAAALVLTDRQRA